MNKIKPKKEKIKKIILFLFTLVCITNLCFLSLAETVNEIIPWKNKAPFPYSKESPLVEESYKEKMEEANIEDYPEEVKKAKEVLQEWGRNSDRYEYQGKHYEYKISVFENKSFVSVTFNPIGLAGLEQHVEIRITKGNLEILSILQGS